MNSWRGRFSRFASIAIVISGSLVFCAEEPISLDKLPQMVIEGLKTRFPKAEMVDAQREELLGQDVYEVTLKIKKQKWSARIASNGGILEVTREISGKDLPDIIADALKAKHPGAVILSAGEVTEVKYNVMVRTEDGQKLELSIDPSGEIEIQE